MSLGQILINRAKRNTVKQLVHIPNADGLQLVNHSIQLAATISARLTPFNTSNMPQKLPQVCFIIKGKPGLTGARGVCALHAGYIRQGHFVRGAT
eukprot:CAMPEP_0172944264 /NCGR_PEP_ID=MMETSP1075-20121228/225960_1 /TAXON_ID=2916 /ORGANISM="Ceratium fusus, Strain PA161109" /LENGTH=94 /DNA_ID=CAMNT_0013805691 /DNA_START=996 /DNA_END=1277 /DNA_ORIENTATION=+